MNNYTYLCRTKPEVGEVSLPVWCQIQISNLILTFQTLNEIVTLIRLQVFSFLLFLRFSEFPSCHLLTLQRYEKYLKIPNIFKIIPNKKCTFYVVSCITIYDHEHYLNNIYERQRIYRAFAQSAQMGLLLGRRGIFERDAGGFNGQNRNRQSCFHQGNRKGGAAKAAREKNREGNPRGIVSIQVCQGHKSMEPGGALCVLRVPVVAIGLSQGMRLEPVAENLYDDGKRQEDNSPVVTLRFLCLICCLHISGSTVFLRKDTNKFRPMAKNPAKSFGVPEIIPIFAASNQFSGMRTAGIISSLFCAPTLRNNRITTPSPDDGNVPGVSAKLDLTARSVVLLCQNQFSYGIKELCDSRERCAACVFLPAAGVQQVQEDDVAPGVGAGRLDRLHLLPPHVGDVRPLRGVRQSHRVPYGDRQPATRPDGSLPGDDVVARQEVGERLHPHRAHQRTAPVHTAARHRLPWMCGTGVIFNLILLFTQLF